MRSVRVRQSGPERSYGRPGDEGAHAQMGIREPEVEMALGCVAVLGGVGLGLAPLFGLEGAASVIPAAALVGLFVLRVVWLNVVDSLELRKRRKRACGASPSRPGDAPEQARASMEPDEGKQEDRADPPEAGHLPRETG